MLQSMTGFGKAELHYANKVIHVEIKSLNSKNIDISTRIAPLYRHKDIEIRKMITQSLLRGKVDFTLWVEKTAEETFACINADLVKEYARQIKAINEEAGITCSEEVVWNVTSRMQDFINTQSNEECSEEEWAEVAKTVQQSIERLIEFRKQEGEALCKMFEEKISNIRALSKEIERFETERVEKIKNRLTERLSELKGVEYDKNRLEQELIYYIEKLDISEEKQRLANHLNYFTKTLNEEVGQGKKLGFIAQEMGREINTTGSKSNQAEMQNVIVKMKDELEQIKEQVLNVL